MTVKRNPLHLIDQLDLVAHAILLVLKFLVLVLSFLQLLDLHLQVLDTLILDPILLLQVLD